ncbi:MAG: thioredoxin [Acetatifactor sp.]|nr:thioredoxin [Acetatifactor sp.]
MELQITTENFEEAVLKSETPVLVDFFAQWCGPCKMMAPVLEEIAKKYEGKLKVGKCDTDDNMLLAQKYRVSSIPNMQLFKNGQVVANYVGFMTADALSAKLDQDL